jgi:hypothetical protein
VTISAEACLGVGSTTSSFEFAFSQSAKYKKYFPRKSIGRMSLTWIISNSFCCHINCCYSWCWKSLNFLITLNCWIFLYKIILFFIDIKILCNITLNICFNIFCYTTSWFIRDNRYWMTTKFIL